jgi:peptide/nickel transport system substrate-binding protein
VTGRSASVGVATALLALLVASPGATSDVREGGTFRIGVGGGNFSPTIDPALPYSISTAMVLKATCAGLLSAPDKPLPAGYRLVPEIAAEFPTVTNGGKTYTFRVRRGFRFSTGRHVTARDVAYSVNRVLRMDEVADWFADVVGAQAVRDGRAQAASGILARGDRLTVRLTRAVGDFAQRIGLECVLPIGTPVDPEGVKAPIPAAGPYYVSEFVPGRRVVLARNRFYRGERPHHVDRFVFDLTLDAPTVLDRVDRGQLDYGWVSTADFSPRVEELRRKYGVGRSRFFVTPGTFLRMFVLNTERPLFRDNVRLRQAVNFAVNRKALLRERGPLAGYLTEQYLPPTFPGFRNEHIYPLKRPDLAKAKTLARGRTRGGKAVLYVPNVPLGVAQGQIVQASLARIGLEVEIRSFPPPVLFDKLGTRGEPFDIGWIGWEAGFPIPDPSLLEIFDGRKIGTPGNQNWSYFDSPRYNRLFAAASRLPIGPQRNAAYGRLDLDLARNAAPAIAYAYDNVLTFVSARTGCVVTNAYLDLAAVCLK